MGISAENRASAGVGAGDEVDVDIALDTESREVSVPPDFAAALDAHPGARQFFHGLSNSQKRWFVDGIEQAKKAETRERRIANAVSRLREGKAQR